MRPIDQEKREIVKKEILKFLKKIDRSTTVGEINSNIGYNPYIIRESIKEIDSIEIKDKRFIVKKVGG